MKSTAIPDMTGLIAVYTYSIPVYTLIFFRECRLWLGSIQPREDNWEKSSSMANTLILSKKSSKVFNILWNVVSLYQDFISEEKMPKSLTKMP